MGRASPRKIHRYSLEFKRQAVKLSQLEGVDHGRCEMRTTFGVILIVGALAGGESGSAQQRSLPAPPDLSGSWTIVQADSSASSPLGARFAVRQDASTITFTSGQEVVTYKLDDSENLRSTQTVTGATWTRASRARFVTSALLVTTRIDAGPTGHWEDLLLVSQDRPGEITVVSCNAVKSMERGMATRVFKYTKAQ
jgi:hypothetical protein